MTSTELLREWYGKKFDVEFRDHAVMAWVEKVIEQLTEWEKVSAYAVEELAAMRKEWSEFRDWVLRLPVQLIQWADITTNQDLTDRPDERTLLNIVTLEKTTVKVGRVA